MEQVVFDLREHAADPIGGEDHNLLFLDLGRLHETCDVAKHLLSERCSGKGSMKNAVGMADCPSAQRLAFLAA